MQPAQQSAKTTTAANVLSGEKSFLRLEFAITGKFDLDIMSGFAAAVDAVWREPTTVFGRSRCLQRICEYLAVTYKDEADRMEKQTTALPQYSPQVFPGPHQQAANPPPEWSVTSGPYHMPEPQTSPIKSLMDEMNKMRGLP